MPIQFSKQELLTILPEASASSSLLDQPFRGAEFDSRNIRGGELFLALQGENEHGHKFLEIAFAAGAALALVEESSFLRHPVFGDRCIQVADSLKAFSVLAKAWRKRLAVPLLGITGSMGKTTTKELATTLLGVTGKGTSSLKSFNNHLGVPYTLCRINEDDAWAVLEMGMNHAGELLELSQLAEPDVVAITCVAPVHTEFFSSLAEIAEAKLEIVSGLRSNGIVVLNGDDSELGQAVARRVNFPRHVRFGRNAGCDLVLKSVRSHGLEGIDAAFVYNQHEFSARLSLPGAHNGMNLACALLAAKTLVPHFDFSMGSAALSTFCPAPMRLNVHTLSNGAQLIDDSYNANPEAMKATIHILQELQRGGKKVCAVLGEMRELGEQAESYHREVGKKVAEAGLDMLVAVGPLAKHYALEAEKSGVQCYLAGTPEEAGSLLKTLSFDVVLVKASRGSRLDKTVTMMLSSGA